MIVLDKVADRLANNTDFIFTEIENGVYMSVDTIGYSRLVVRLVLDESDGLVLVSGALHIGSTEFHTYTYVKDNYEQILLAVEKLNNKAMNVVKTLNEFEELN